MKIKNVISCGFGLSFNAALFLINYASEKNMFALISSGIFTIIFYLALMAQFKTEDK